MFKVLVNYNFTPDKDFVGDDYLIYDRSDSKEWLKDFDQSKIFYTENIGNVDKDKLTYLIDHYYDLPEVFVWGKTNMFKYVAEKDFWDAVDRAVYTPLLKHDHATYSDADGVVCFYKDGMYWERSDSWYFWQFHHVFQNYNAFAREFQLPTPAYIPFNPGGNFILTRDKVLQYSKDYYEKLRSALVHAQLPAEAHAMERSYFTIFK